MVGFGVDLDLSGEVKKIEYRSYLVGECVPSEWKEYPEEFVHVFPWGLKLKAPFVSEYGRIWEFVLWGDMKVDVFPISYQPLAQDAIDLWKNNYSTVINGKDED